MHRVIIILPVIGFLSGCAGQRPAARGKHYLPTQAAEFYLRNLPDVTMEPGMYKCLSSSTRARFSFPCFASYLSAFRPPGVKGDRKGRVTIVDRVDLSDSRSVIYALFQWPPPAEDFMLVRVDCRLEGGRWGIELPPGEGLIRPVDVIMGGRKLDDEAYEKVMERSGNERAAVMRDLERGKREEETRALARAREDSIASLVARGKECYNNGRYREAMTAFGKALRLDPENGQARGYMAKCRKALKGE